MAAPAVAPLNSVPQGSARGIIAQGMQRLSEGKAEPQPNIEKLSPLVVCVLAQNPSAYTLNGTNTYFVGSGKRRILMDTGESGRSATRYVEVLERAMAQEGIEEIQDILVTHCHGDHLGGIQAIHARFGANIRVAKFPMPEVNLDWLSKNGSLAFAESMIKFQSQTWYRTIAEGQVFKTEGATLVARYAPGHCTDHVVFQLLEEKAVFTGDNILGHGSTYVTELTDYMQTLDKLLGMADTEPADAPLFLYPSHGKHVKDGRAWIEAYMTHRRVREDQVAKFLRRARTEGRPPMTAETVAQELYPSATAWGRKQATENILVILKKLQRDGSIVGQGYEESEEVSGPLKRLAPLWLAKNRSRAWSWREASCL